MIDTLLTTLWFILTGIVIPILYYLQLRDLKTSIRSSTHASIYSQAETLRGYLIQYPDLRKYFFDNEQITAENKEFNRVVSIAEIYLNYLEHIAVLRDTFGKQNIDSLNRFAVSALDKSPIMKQLLGDNAPMYSDTLHGITKMKE